MKTQKLINLNVENQFHIIQLILEYESDTDLTKIYQNSFSPNQIFTVNKKIFSKLSNLNFKKKEYGCIIIKQSQKHFITSNTRYKETEYYFQENIYKGDYAKKKFHTYNTKEEFLNKLYSDFTKLSLKKYDVITDSPVIITLIVFSSDGDNLDNSPNSDDAQDEEFLQAD
jgi:hypothetical protein